MARVRTDRLRESRVPMRTSRPRRRATSCTPVLGRSSTPKVDYMAPVVWLSGRTVRVDLVRKSRWRPRSCAGPASYLAACVRCYSLFATLPSSRARTTAAVAHLLEPLKDRAGRIGSEVAPAAVGMDARCVDQVRHSHVAVRMPPSFTARSAGRDERRRMLRIRGG